MYVGYVYRRPISWCLFVVVDAVDEETAAKDDDDGGREFGGSITADKEIPAVVADEEIVTEGNAEAPEDEQQIDENKPIPVLDRINKMFVCLINSTKHNAFMLSFSVKVGL